MTIKIMAFKKENNPKKKGGQSNFNKVKFMLLNERDNNGNEILLNICI